MSPAKAKIAILLAAYNGMLWIEEQLATIQAQIDVEVNIFISVDASTDDTYSWCSNYVKHHPNTSLLTTTERCGGASRNFFRLIRDVDIGNFDLVALADQDDLWHPDKLARASHHLATYPVQAYSSNVIAFWPNGTTRVLEKSQPQVRWDHYFEAAGPGCTYVLKKSFAIQLQDQVRQQWLDLQRVTLHDWYIYAVARSRGYAWYIDPTPSMDYRQHLSNQVGANVGFRALVSRYQTIRSGWWLGQVMLIERLVNQRQPRAVRPTWRSLTRRDLMGLALSANQCRRRPRDRWLFRLVCIITAVLGVRIK